MNHRTTFDPAEKDVNANHLIIATNLSYILSSFFTKATGFTVDTLPGLGVDLIGQILGIVETAWMN